MFFGGFVGIGFSSLCGSWLYPHTCGEHNHPGTRARDLAWGFAMRSNSTSAARLPFAARGLAGEDSRREATLFDDVFLETLDERDHVALLGLGHLELRQGRGSMTEEHVPVALADAHASVDQCHVPAAIVHRSDRVRREEVDQELLIALDAV